MLNTILYNSNEEIDDEVNRRLINTPTATTIPPIGPSVKDNVRAITPNNDAIFDQRIDLITEGIDSFMASNLRELPKDNALTLANYILSMKSEINLSDNYRRLNIYALYRLSRFFSNRNQYKELARDDLLQFLDSFRKPEADDTLHKWIGTL
jgi:hypothetical protein